MEEDYNRFDSFHATTRHPLMTDAEWNDAYRFAWREFYTVGAMKGVLARADRENYWGLFKNFAWYRYAIQVEDTHPMISGFVRLKDRRDRRPGFAVESRLAHARRRTREMAQWARRVVPLYFEMQEVWLATRARPRFRSELDRIRRVDLRSYWRQTGERLRRGQIFRINPFRLAYHTVRDAWLCLRFNASFFAGYGK